MKKLSFKVSIFLGCATLVVMSVFSFWLIQQETQKLENMILEKGTTSARIGAFLMGYTLESIIDNGIYTKKEVFDQQLVPAIVPSIYKNITAEQLKQIQKYHYKTGLDSYLDNAILEIEDQFLTDTHLEYAVIIDKSGYAPVHNSRFNQRFTGDYEYDKTHNRTKRIYRDRASYNVLKNTETKVLKQPYYRNTGEKIWDLSYPVYVKGEHWGGFRIGISMSKTAAMVTDLRNKLIFIMCLIILLNISIIIYVINKFMTPLGHLHKRVKQLATGDLSVQAEIETNDEIGELAQAFNHMVGDLRTYINNLASTTAAKERIENELKIAREIQHNMLPKIFPPFPEKMEEFDVYAFIESAKEVGGDFYDYHLVGDYFCFTIGDVSGKGVPASLFMAVTLTLMRATQAKTIAPAEVLTMVNKELCQDNSSSLFVTVFYGVIDIKTGILEYSVGGHPPPFLISPTNSDVTELPITEDMALGIDDTYQYRTRTMQLIPGATIFLYTDGVTEARDNEHEFYTDHRLSAILSKVGHKSAKEIIYQTMEDVQTFIKDAQPFDDITMLTFKYLCRQNK